MGGIKLKRKMSITFLVVIVLGLCAFWIWSYLKPIDSSTFSGFVKSLRRSGYDVKDVTKQTTIKDKKIKLANNEMLLDASGEKIYVIIGNAETVEAILQNQISALNTPLGEFKSLPHLYNKDYLVVTYIGEDKKLLETLEEGLGKSLVN